MSWDTPTKKMEEIMRLMAEGWSLSSTKKKWSLNKADLPPQKVNAGTAKGMIDRELIYRTCGPYQTIKSFSLTRYGREVLGEMRDKDR